MENIEQVFKKMAGVFGIICLTSLLLSSCSKDHYSRVDPLPSAQLSVINASPDSQPLDFYVDQTQANFHSIAYGNGLTYLGIKPGNHKATFYVANTQQVIKSDSITLKQDKSYTLYLSNIVSSPDYLLLTDSLVKPAFKTATIRLVNVSPDAPAMDLAINGGPVLVSNKGYKGYSGFVPVAVPLKGDTTYTFEVRKTGTTQNLTSLANVTVRIGSVYTIWVQGLASGTGGQQISAGLQTNGSVH